MEKRSHIIRVNPPRNGSEPGAMTGGNVGTLVSALNRANSEKCPLDGERCRDHSGVKRRVGTRAKRAQIWQRPLEQSPVSRESIFEECLRSVATFPRAQRAEGFQAAARRLPSDRTSTRRPLQSAQSLDVAAEVRRRFRSSAESLPKSGRTGVPRFAPLPAERMTINARPSR